MKKILSILFICCALNAGAQNIWRAPSQFMAWTDFASTFSIHNGTDSLTTRNGVYGYPGIGFSGRGSSGDTSYIGCLNYDGHNIPVMFARNGVNFGYATFADTGFIIGNAQAALSGAYFGHDDTIGYKVNGYTFRLPKTDTTAGYLLGTNGSGQYGFYAPAAGGSGWNLTGNAGTNPLSNFIGTLDSVDFVIKTNGQEAIRIDSGQNVGIGIGLEEPHARLQIAETHYPLLANYRAANYSGSFLLGNGDGAVIIAKDTTVGLRHDYYVTSANLESTINNDSASGVFTLHHDPGRVQFTFGNNIFVFDTAGHVSINEPPTTATLNVNGSLYQRQLYNDGNDYVEINSDTTNKITLTAYESAFSHSTSAIFNAESVTISQTGTIDGGSTFGMSAGSAYMATDAGATGDSSATVGLGNKQVWFDFTTTSGQHSYVFPNDTGSVGDVMVVTANDGTGVTNLDWRPASTTALDSVTIYALTPTLGTQYYCTDCSGNGIAGRIVAYIGAAWRRLLFE